MGPHTGSTPGQPGCSQGRRAAQRAWCPGAPDSELCSGNRRLSRELQPLLRLLGPQVPGSPQDGDPLGRQAPPLASLGASRGQPVPGRGRTAERGTRLAWASAQTAGPSGIEQRPGTPSGHPGSGGTPGGRGEAETMQRADRWAGDPRPCSLAVTPNPAEVSSWRGARGTPTVIFGEGAAPPPLRSSLPPRAPRLPLRPPPSRAGPPLRTERSCETPNPPGATLPPAAGTGPEAGSHPELREPMAAGATEFCRSGRRPGKAVPCRVQRQAALEVGVATHLLGLAVTGCAPQSTQAGRRGGRDGARPGEQLAAGRPA